MEMKNDMTGILQEKKQEVKGPSVNTVRSAVKKSMARYGDGSDSWRINKDPLTPGRVLRVTLPSQLGGWVDPFSAAPR